VVGLLPSASGPVCLGMAFPPFLMKQLYCCDSVCDYVRPEWVNRWPNSMTDIWWWWYITMHGPQNVIEVKNIAWQNCLQM